MSDASKAVFLSYASQDADAAKKICDALRQAGVEVWFDQSELVGGDAWDQKIRRQIKDCALFVPIISASTQARREGYFRIEWKLAAQRTHAFADGTPFLLPVVLDATHDADALVPEEFCAVQWTRLNVNDTPEMFAVRVGRLLGDGLDGGRPLSAERGEGASSPHLANRRSISAWAWGALIAAVLFVGIAAFQSLRRPASATETQPAPPAPLISDKSLVVLPLENLSPDPENAFFTNGMHSEIISTLSRLTDLKVISRASALAFKGSMAPVAEIAQKLGVANVITGSVNRAAGRVRITLELRRGRDEALLWSKPYDRDLKDQIAIQTDIADEVARVLQARASEGTSTSARFFTRDPRAYDLFFKANEWYFSGKSGSFDQAIPLLEEALQLDPEYFSAAFALSAAHTNRFFLSGTGPAKRVRDVAEARHWAEVASRLMPGGAGDNALILYLEFFEQDYLRALELGERTMRALPNETASPTFYAIALHGLGRTGESLVFFRRALQLNPPNRFSIWWELTALVELRRQDEAAAAVERAMAVLGENFDRPSLASWRFQLAGDLPAGLEEMTRREQPMWLWRARRFGEIGPVVEAELPGDQTNDADRFALRLLQHDALRRQGRDLAAEDIARELLDLARRLQDEVEFGPSRKAGWLAHAQARAGSAQEAIAAGRHYVEAASPTAQVNLRWQREASLAEIYAYLKRPRECVELLAKLLRVPSGLTVPMLRIAPEWDNVREDAGFKALLADPKNSVPL